MMSIVEVEPCIEGEKGIGHTIKTFTHHVMHNCLGCVRCKIISGFTVV